MSDGPCKSEAQHRIDTLQEMANTEHQLRMARTQYESAKWELVRASEALLEWQSQWSRERRAVFACYPDATPIDSVVEDARITMDRFCAEVRAKNEHIAALSPQDAPDTRDEEDEEESDHYFLRPNKPVAPDLTAVDPEPDPAQRSVEIDGEWIDGDDEAGLKRSAEYSQGFEAGRLGHSDVAGASENWWTGYADGKARRDEVAASEGYAPVVAADEAEPEPSLLDRFNPFRVKADA